MVPSSSTATISTYAAFSLSFRFVMLRSLHGFYAASFWLSRKLTCSSSVVSGSWLIKVVRISSSCRVLFFLRSIWLMRPVILPTRMSFQSIFLLGESQWTLLLSAVGSGSFSFQLFDVLFPSNDEYVRGITESWHLVLVHLIGLEFLFRARDRELKTTLKLKLNVVIVRMSNTVVVAACHSTKARLIEEHICSNSQ